MGYNQLNCQQEHMNVGYSNLYMEVMENYINENKCTKLYSKIQNKYQIGPFKISKMTGTEAISAYEKIMEKYNQNQLEEMPHDWHKNQRKLFNWFLICYCQLNAIMPNFINDLDWQKIGKTFQNKNWAFVKFQGLNIVKKVQKYQWMQEDDQILKDQVKKQGITKWNQISKDIFMEKNKFITPKQCRQRWFNHVNDQLDKGQWRVEEEYILLNYVLEHGKKWAKMTKQLKNKRTQHMIKNKYHSIIHKNRKGSEDENDIVRQRLNIIKAQMEENGEALPKLQQHSNEMEDQEVEESISDQKQKKKEEFNQGFIVFKREGDKEQQNPTFFNSSLHHPSPFSLNLDQLNKFNQFQRFRVEGYNRSQDLISPCIVRSKPIMCLDAFQRSETYEKLKGFESTSISNRTSLEYLKPPSSDVSQTLKIVSGMGEDKPETDKAQNN